MALIHSKSVSGKNIARRDVNYQFKLISKYKLQNLFYRLLLKTVAAVILLVMCNLVEISRLQTVKEVAKTAKELVCEEQLRQAFPVEM